MFSVLSTKNVGGVRGHTVISRQRGDHDLPGLLPVYRWSSSSRQRGLGVAKLCKHEVVVRSRPGTISATHMISARSGKP